MTFRLLETERFRVGVRRWRLWWRFKLRILRWRAGRTLRIWVRPDGGLPANKLALRTGRLAGRIYLWGGKTRERLRIARARTPDRIEPTRTTLALWRRQGALLVALFVLIVLGLSTLAVLSLISFREVGLLSALPHQIAAGLRGEITQELVRAQRTGAGRSVERYSRGVLAADLQIFSDLITRLKEDDEPLDVA